MEWVDFGLRLRIEDLDLGFKGLLMLTLLEWVSQDVDFVGLGLGCMGVDGF